MIDADRDNGKPVRAVWSAPRLERLPKLTSLTLVTPSGDIIDGVGNVGGGSTVF